MTYSEAAKKATLKYRKNNIKIIKFELNKNTDQDIIQKLESVESKQGYFKKLVREDIAKEQS